MVTYLLVDELVDLRRGLVFRPLVGSPADDGIRSTSAIIISCTVPILLACCKEFDGWEPFNLREGGREGEVGTGGREEKG